MNMFCYCQGKAAYARGLDITDNPYNVDAEKWAAWHKGWRDMEARD